MFQRILNNMEQDPWWIRTKRFWRVEIAVVRSLGFVKYIKHYCTKVTNGTWARLSRARKAIKKVVFM
jgi:hypothetical protein